jgi:Helix-turn-helix domain
MLPEQAPVAEARMTLGRRLASLRQAAGFTQAHAGGRLGYSRSAVARAEATGVCSRDFCLAAGRLFGAGEELALAHDQIAGMAAAARAQAARQARQRQSPESAELTDDGDITFSVLEATCPHCDKTVAVLVRHGTALLPLESPHLPA